MPSPDFSPRDAFPMRARRPMRTDLSRIVRSIRAPASIHVSVRTTDSRIHAPGPTKTPGERMLRSTRAPEEITHPSVIMLSRTIAPSWIATGGRSSERVCTIHARSFKSIGGGVFSSAICVCQYASVVPTSTQ
jgi:hypothetical protein